MGFVKRGEVKDFVTGDVSTGGEASLNNTADCCSEAHVWGTNA